MASADACHDQFLLAGFADLNVLDRDEPSSAQRQVAYDTMKLYRALHTQALQGESAVFAPVLYTHFVLFIENEERLQQDNDMALAADQDKATRLQGILEYSQEITSVLQAACSR